MEGLHVCNMGVIDVREVDEIGNALEPSFSIAEFRTNNPSWSHSQPRPTVKYPKSPNIELSRLATILEGFSMSSDQGNSWRMKLRDTIQKYVLNVDSTKHMFCIHPRSCPEFYYERTVLNVPGKLTERRKNPFPRVLIVAHNPREAGRIYEALLKESANGRRKCFIRNLDGHSATESSFHPRVMVGSFRKITEYLEEVKTKRPVNDFASFVKLVVFNSAEKLTTDRCFATFMEYMTLLLDLFWTRFIFMFNFVTPPGSVLNTVKFCQKSLKEGMFIEVDKPNVRDLFSRVEFRLAVPSTEYTDSEVARALDKGNPLTESHLLKTSIVMTPEAQKFYFCRNIIQKLREERQQQENYRRRDNNWRNKANDSGRKERILIVTRYPRTARLVLMNLRQRVSKSEKKFQYNVHKILIGDSDEEVEKRNLEFRFGDLDVLVIDWRSIEAVQRGTVDAVIMYDSPDPRYFQTVMETEMENLISFKGVKLKLYILLDKEADFRLTPHYLKFLEKHKKCAPQWFRALYDKYLADWRVRRAEQDMREDTIVVQANHDDETLQ